MSRKHRFAWDRSPARIGFTLVELLVVIAVIALLVGITVPVVSGVRTSARVAQTEATFRSLSIGLESFRSDAQAGGRYVPSRSDNPDRLVANPISSSVRDASQDEIEISGGGLLLWGLTGADVLGTPGFKDINGNSVWWDDTSSEDTSGDVDGLYELNNGEPLLTRAKLYVSTDEVPTMQAESDSSSPDELVFVSRAEQAILRNTAPRGSGTSGGAGRFYQMFEDGFGTPILYWRADPAGRVIADDVPAQVRAERGIYHFSDNAALLTSVGPLSSNGDPMLVTSQALVGADSHYMLRDTNGFNNQQTVTELVADAPNSFAATIVDRSNAAQVRPQRPDSFILLSAGPDQIFGTADDLGNFRVRE